ncbi:hypothetical protein TorRG33x02_084460 [Trema orientale]|uniref:Uncharacterized protein n=1 Tax=Trema orientale TaxID=63057 RepID=A0A2P5FCU2_TREOI|nr:hypothetical protein TorRG33x02_084460 [Trema orientale]
MIHSSIYPKGSKAERRFSKVVSQLRPQTKILWWFTSWSVMSQTRWKRAESLTAASHMRSINWSFE